MCWDREFDGSTRSGDKIMSFEKGIVVDAVLCNMSRVDDIDFKNEPR